MNKRSVTTTIVAFALLAGALVSYYRWTKPEPDPVVELLSHLAPNAESVWYVDLEALRQSAFLAAFYKWIPQSQSDADYAQFMQATGFNYERDLHRLAVATYNDGFETTLLAIADGKFDRKKITAYTLQTGRRTSRDGREVFSIAVDGGTRQASFTFLRNDRIAISNRSDAGFGPFSSNDPDARAWSERFRRLAGSAIFGVFREGAAPIHSISGLRSADLSGLLSQLQWITVAGKPDADNLRVVLEGEGPPQTNTLQMSDLINGLLVFAQTGLNDPKTRAQLQPQVRDAYLDLLKSADVSRLDRGDTKSVRLIFEVTPGLLDALRPTAAGEAPSLLQKLYPDKNKVRN